VAGQVDGTKVCNKIMETIELLGKLWYLGAAIVAIAAYAVTIKVRVDYLEKGYDKQVTELWKHVNELKGKQ
jgi:hypothetical protein